MKILIFLTCLLCPTAFGITNFPNGVYQGAGEWKTDKSYSGTYEVTTTIDNNELSGVYLDEDGRDTFRFTARFNDSGFFDVVIENHVVGKGYCYSVQCHYSLKLNGFSLAETLTFKGENLYKLGSRVERGKSSVWQESLTKK